MIAAFATAIAGLILIGILHLVLKWMEGRGWIRYSKSGEIGTAAGNALLDLSQILEPQKKHVLEMKRTRRRESDDAGDGKK